MPPRALRGGCGGPGGTLHHSRTGENDEHPRRQHQGSRPAHRRPRPMAIDQDHPAGSVAHLRRWLSTSLHVGGRCTIKGFIDHHDVEGQRVVGVMAETWRVRDHPTSRRCGVLASTGGAASSPADALRRHLRGGAVQAFGHAVGGDRWVRSKHQACEKEVNLFDGDGLRSTNRPLSEGGKKNWYFRYAVPVTKKRTWVSLGTYPHLTLAKARALRDEYLSLLANGIDPQVHNTHKANALNLAGKVGR